MELIDELIILAGQNAWEKIRSLIAEAPIIAKTLYHCKRNALTELSYYGDIETVALLLKHGGNPNLVDDLGQTALFSALASARGGYNTLSVIKKLLDAGVDPNAIAYQCDPALHIATGYRLANCMSILLDAGANPYQKNVDQVPEDVFDVARRTRSAIIMSVLTTWESTNIKRGRHFSKN